MSDQYKFEMIRFDESAEINTCHTVRVRAAMCPEIVTAFAEFMQACGFARESVVEAFQQVEDELSVL